MSSGSGSEGGGLGLYAHFWFLVSFDRVLNLLRAILILCNNVYSIAAYFAILIAFLPLRLINEPLYWNVEERLFGYLLSQVGIWNYTAGYYLAESGHDLDAEMNGGSSFLFLPNHQSTADVPFCMSLFASRPRGPDKVMWIMDKVFKYTNFGAVAWMHDDFFILAGKKNRDKSLEKLRSHLKNVFIPKKRKYLVLFPEGGFLRKRKDISNEFAKKNDLPQLEHVTLPRTGALEVALEILGSPKNNNNGLTSTNSKITKIVDVTIAYPDGKPLDLIAILFGHRPSCVTHVHYRIFDVKDIPSDSEGIKNWMYKLYIEKELLLNKYYETGVWPHDLLDKKAKLPKKLVHDPLFYVCLHIGSIATFTLASYLSYHAYYFINNSMLV